MVQDTKRRASFFDKCALKAPRGFEERLQKTLKALRLLPREELSFAGRLTEDNARFLLDEAEETRRLAHLSPRLPGENRTPRVYTFARDLAMERKELSAPRMVKLINAWEVAPAQEELEALPLALKAALLKEMEEALSCVEAEADAARRGGQMAKDYLSGKRDTLPRDDGLMAFMLEKLSALDEGDAVARAREALLREGRNAEKILQAARDRAARAGLDAANLVGNLKKANRLSMEAILERTSPVIRIFRQNPVFRQMDRESRAYYVHCVCRLAKKWKVDESEAARAAVSLAQGKSGHLSDLGYYLVERPDLLAAALGRGGEGGFALRHRQGLFLLPLYGGAALSLGAGIILGAPWYAWPLIPLCASHFLRLIYGFILRKRLPARRLPRLRVEKLTKERRTLIVVPALLNSRKQAMRMARQLSILRCANPDPYLEFMLLGDFIDSREETESGDEEIVSTAALAVDALNRQWGGGFLYLHRTRKWDMGQRRYTGRERKRGALEALNQWITEGTCKDSFAYTSVAGETLFRRYAYVITLDADTFLPPGAAYRLVGAAAHPLQKGRVGVIQPRMAVGPDTVRTRAQRWLGGRGGADAYHLAVQDIYQDVFGRGSFVGKGIYDPFVWTNALKGRLPTGRLLSHDLIEGEIVGSALADDIVLYDGHPARLSGWQKRLHRWTRGDWQLLPFLGDRRLSLLSRHKIWDNLRRSLLPAAQALLLIIGAGNNMPALFFLALPLPIPGILCRALMLPGKAWTLLDAATRALYRMNVSHRELLSWVTAAQAEGEAGEMLPGVLCQLALGTGLIFVSLLPGAFWPGALMGIGWVTAPLLMGYADRPPKNRPGFTPRMRESVRSLGRATWCFFEDAVTEETHFLPPDNLQLDPPRGSAMRTSPTNIGLYLLSCCAARELNIITTADMVRRVKAALNTLKKMETWKGHYYNWYDLNNLNPLPPRFVSTVDSGNLMGCLLCCAQIFRNHLREMKEEDQILSARMDEMARSMDFFTLYDQKEHLFFVGWEIEEKRPSAAHYDSLASEARLASFLAVMTGQVEEKHWRHLNRSLVPLGGGPTLLSWGGTMFEYLMPQLLLPTVRGTLLGESVENAVRAQMAYRPERPFGVSESGYYAFDPELHYQYRAFGLPMLARTGETEGNVVAPYASMLALPFFPRAAAENLDRMRRMGWVSEYGLYEAADYTPQRIDETPRIVKSHMAHHQGMVLCAVCNALNDQALVKAFCVSPQAEAYRYLLQEAAPHKARRRRELPKDRREESHSLLRPRIARLGFPMDAQALWGHGTTWVTTAQGQGYLAHRDMMVTRFDPQAGAQTGPQLYIRDAQTGAFFRPLAEGNLVFEGGAVSARMAWAGVRVTVKRCVDPVLGAALEWVELENPGLKDRELEAATYLEIAQGPQKADAAHPNFRDLSVRVKPLGNLGLVSRRLPREEGDEMPLIGHLAAGDILSLRCQGDRSLFLGRLGTYAAPEQMEKDAGDCLFRTGDVIAPCLSLRAKIRVPAQGLSRVCFVTCPGDSEEALLGADWTEARIQSAFSLAAAQARTAARLLRAEGPALSLYQQMLGAMLFYDQPHQARGVPASRQALWRLGVSGEDPVLLVDLTLGMDQALSRHALSFHAWAKGQGIKTDVVFLLPVERDYHRPAHDQLARLISSGLGDGDGVRITEGGENEKRTLESLSRMTLRGGVGLHGQMSALRMPENGETDAALRYPEAPASVPLSDDNGYGGFLPGGAYRVRLAAPSPWYHLLCGANFGTLICDTGILQSYAGNSFFGRLTRKNPDAHRGVPSEEIYIRDQENRVYPLCRGAAVYEPGAGAYQGEKDQMKWEVTVFSYAKLPLGVRTVTIKSQEEKNLELIYLVRFSLGENEEYTRAWAREGMAFAGAGEENALAFAAMEGGYAQAAASGIVYGLRGQKVPPAVLSTHLVGGGSVGVLRREIRVSPRESCRVVLALGASISETEGRRLFQELLSQGALEAEKEERAAWSGRLNQLVLFSLDERLEKMMNLWLPYQVISARLLARMGPYQPGGAFGFRDQLQDCLALLYTDPLAVRAHLLLCAAHQFPEGDVQHWWHAPSRGVRTRISDDKLFLPYLAALYIQSSGDEGILRESVPYLSSEPLKAGEGERYGEMAEGAFAEPFFTHCLRAIDSVRLGPHGLPLMGGGDWNDGMNRVGGERGESVWLGFFLAVVLKRFSALCPMEEKQKYTTLRRRLLEAAESAWTGKWYLRAWRDDGSPLSGPDTDPPRIDLISQCFAVLAGAPRDHAREAMIHAVDLLYDREAGMVKLLDPPFEPQERAGYIGAYLPGVRENGGQYTHAVPWLVMALCRLGEYGLAWEIARIILPMAHSDTMEKADRYKIEPYVLAGDVYAGESRGRGGWSWYTGSAAWLYYVVLTELLGFEKRGERARLTPHVPKDMDGFTLVFRFGSAAYHFTAARDTVFPTLDGARLEDGWVTLRDDGRIHEARYPMRGFS